MRQSYLPLFLVGMLAIANGDDRPFDMDRLATCGQDITVFENTIVLNGRSNAAPANPPLECTVYLMSGYTEANGNYRLQIVIEAIDIQDCEVRVDVFNGRGAFGSYLRSLGCNSMSTDTLYTQGREATIRFSRPNQLYQTAYTFTFRINTYRDVDGGGYNEGTNKLSPGLIIGIIIGIVALFVVGILVLWCYRTGRIGTYYGAYAGDEKIAGSTHTLGESNGAASLGNAESIGSAIDHRDPGVWASVTKGQYNPTNKLGRTFQKRNEFDRQLDQNGYGQPYYNAYNQRQSSAAVDGQRYSKYDDSYEPYDRDQQVHLTRPNNENVAGWKKGDDEAFVRNGSKRASTGSKGKGPGDGEDDGTFKRDNGTKGSRGSRGSRGSTNSKRASFADKKGTGEGDDENGDDNQAPDEYGEFSRDAPGVGTLRSSEHDSTRGSKRGRNNDIPVAPDIPETTIQSESDPKSDVDKNKRFFPDENQSEADSETIENPTHVNAAVRASVPGSKPSPRSRKKKKKNGRQAEEDAQLPPEAQEPVFVTAGSEVPYDTTASLPYTAYGVPSYDAMYPNQYGMQYGMMPMGGYVPMPGQTIAYYQMGPIPGAAQGGMTPEQQQQQQQQQQAMMSGQPTTAGQAAWYVQDTPQGPVKKGFMVTTSPSKKNRYETDASGAVVYPGMPDYTSTPADALTPKRRRHYKPPGTADAMDISTIAAGGPPPEPGAGQRSVVMRKGVDPDSGMHVDQVVWRDTAVNPTDPTPDDNPQITRKTLTRITTRSGHGDLPTNQNPVPYNDYSDRLGIESESPGFLSPVRAAPALPPAVTNPNTDNIEFYLGQGRPPGAPEPVIHNSGSRNTAFRDRITFDESAA